MLKVEQGGMAEVLANIYAFTVTPNTWRWQNDFATMRSFNPWPMGKTVLPAGMATRISPSDIGYQRIYELTAIPVGHVGEKLFYFVAHDRSFVTGGHGLYEHFFPVDKLKMRCIPPTGPKPATPTTC